MASSLGLASGLLSSTRWTIPRWTWPTSFESSLMRATIRWEAIMIALFGTTLGVAVGSFFGWASIRALRSEGIDRFVFPVTNLAVVTLVACLAGAVAAIVPARRAARLDVLDALSAD